MKHSTLELPTLSIRAKEGRNVQGCLIMRVNEGIYQNPLAGEKSGCSSSAFASFSPTDRAQEFEISFRGPCRELRPLFPFEGDRDEIFRLLHRLAEALDEVHARGLILGFLWSESLLIDRSGLLRVPDWFLRWDASHLPELSIRLPEIAPEFLREKQLVPATDQFSLACIAHRLIYGVPPFRSDSKTEQLLRILHGMWQEPMAIESDIGICDVWDRAFSVQPEWRFESCIAFVDGLRFALSSQRAAGENAAEFTPAQPKLQRHAISSFIWLAASLMAIGSVALGAWSAALSKKLQNDNQQIQSYGGNHSTVDNGVLNVCNSSARPIQIVSLGSVYRKDGELREFTSSEHPLAKWTIPPASSQSLSLVEDTHLIWDGATSFYYLSYQVGDNLYVATGIWKRPSGQCLILKAE